MPPAGRPSSRVLPAAIVPRVQKRASAGTVRIDLHVHSSASFDCRVDPFDVAQKCKELGLSPIVLTDHDVITGVRELADHGEPVIVGQEVMTSEGELMGLFLTDPVPAGMSPEATARAIHEQGALVCLQHPYDPTRRNLREAAIERIAGSIDLVEVVNGRSRSEFNRRAEELRATLGVPGGAGSDAHSLAEIGRVYVELERFDGLRDFLVKLRQGKIVDRR